MKYHLSNIASSLKYLKGVRTRSGNDLKKTEASEILDEELHSEMYENLLQSIDYSVDVLNERSKILNANLKRLFLKYRMLKIL